MTASGVELARKIQASSFIDMSESLISESLINRGLEWLKVVIITTTANQVPTKSQAARWTLHMGESLLSQVIF